MEWKTIDSIPNGKLVLLWMPEMEMFAAGPWRGRVSWCARDLQPVYVSLQTFTTLRGKQLWVDMDGPMPTHWMPLPPPPSTT